MKKPSKPSPPAKEAEAFYKMVNGERVPMRDDEVEELLRERQQQEQRDGDQDRPT